MLYDITRPVTPDTPVWPGDEPFSLDWSSRILHGDIANVAVVRFGTHTGTHVDAPFHLLAGGAPLEDLPLARFVGPAIVASADAGAVIDEPFAARLLDRHAGVTRILFRTGAWSVPDRFPARFPVLHPAAADLLVRAGVVLVGTDAPSVDPLDSGDLPSHRILLSAGVVILENLTLSDIPAGSYELIALPMRLDGVDAAPIRAILRTT